MRVPVPAGLRNSGVAADETGDGRADGTADRGATDRRAQNLLQITSFGGSIRRPFSILATLLLVAGVFGFLASRSIDTAFAAPCATPGTDGPGGTLTGTVNTYYPGTANAAAGAAAISVGASRGAATAIAAGDLLLVVQMQDAAINSTDTDSYGNGVAGGVASGVTSLNNSGKYEYVRATSAVVAGSVGISGAGAGSGLVNSYTNAAATAAQGQRRFQVIRVPQYSTATLGSGLTAAAWDGTSGGVLAVDVTGTLALGGASVDVTGLGFRGGGARQLTGAGGGSNTAYRSLATANYHAQKGEGIAGTPRYVRNGVAAATDTGVEGYPNGSSARGAPGTAGGGGTDGDPAANDENSGGGGGANGGTGGQGGNTWSSNLARGGYGGTAYAGSVSQLVLGSGGGAGTRNNSPSIPAASAGGNGGGLVMVRAGNLTGSGTITADGQSGVVPENDAGGGGGAGGSVMVLSGGGGTGGLTVNARGAVGGDGEQATSGSHGPGGGGGGGVVVLSGAAAAVNVAGGGAGDTNNGSGTFIPYGATAGANGTSTTSATLPGVPGVSAGTECTPQLTVTKSTSTPVVVDSGSGGTATYTITVANAAGQAAATNTSISDALPSGFTFASTTSVTLSGGATRPATSNPSVGSTTPAWGSFTIPGGGQVQVTFTTTVAAGTTPATYQNPATATYTDPARAVAGGTTSASYNSASSTNEDVQVRLPIADVAVTKTVSNATPALNANVTFTVTVTNSGPELARAVSVADALPAGLTFVSATPSVGAYNSGTGVWTVGNLANGANATLSLVATVTTHTLLTNTATGSTTSTDPTPANNAASATVNVPDANLAVTKTVSHRGAGRDELGELERAGHQPIVGVAAGLPRRQRQPRRRGPHQRDQSIDLGEQLPGRDDLRRPRPTQLVDRHGRVHRVALAAERERQRRLAARTIAVPRPRLAVTAQGQHLGIDGRATPPTRRERDREPHLGRRSRAPGSRLLRHGQRSSPFWRSTARTAVLWAATRARSRAVAVGSDETVMPNWPS